MGGDWGGGFEAGGGGDVDEGVGFAEGAEHVGGLAAEGGGGAVFELAADEVAAVAGV